MTRHPTAPRRTRWLIPTFLGVAVLGLWGSLGLERANPLRGPSVVPNPDAAAPVVSLIGSVRHVTANEGPERLLPDTTAPAGGARLLWLDGRVARSLPDGGAVTLDAAGSVLHFDRKLRARRVPVEADGRELVSVAPAEDGGLWAADAAGEVLRIDREGHPAVVSRSPFDYADLASDPRGGPAWVVRSPERFAYRWYPDRPPPVLAALDSAARVTGTIGPARIPAHGVLADLANAGRVAVRGDTIFYAPFIRDEIVALRATGDTLWLASRALAHSRPEPRFELVDGRAVIDYAPVNLGVVIGPDDRLYVLSTDSSTVSARLDVFDRYSGRLLRTAHLPSALPTLAADETGRVYLLDSFRLLTGVAPREREAFRPFALEQLDGNRRTLASLRDTVTLINFWASWCAPCRIEMPALDRLRRGIRDPAFQFVTISDDADPADAARFIEEYGFDFPVLLGRGEMKRQYHYVGLPFTVLVDRAGRVVQRWLGFAGEEQLAAIRRLVLAELARPAADPAPHQHHLGAVP